MALRSTIRKELNDIGGAFYDSVTVGVNPMTHTEFEDRANHLPTITQRLAVRGLTFAVRHGGRAPIERIAIRAYRGEQILGLGHHSVVLADGDYSVRKIMHRTNVLTPEEQQRHADHLASKQQLLIDAFGDRVLAQRFAVEPFPPNPNVSCVTAYQARVREGIPSNIIDPSNTMLAYLAECRDVYEARGVMSDIVGLGNTFETANELVIVDTIPLLSSDPRDANALVLAHEVLSLHGLGEGLRVPATPPAEQSTLQSHA